MTLCGPLYWHWERPSQGFRTNFGTGDFQSISFHQTATRPDVGSPGVAACDDEDPRVGHHSDWERGKISQKNKIPKIKSSQQTKQDEVSRALWVSKRSHTSHIARSRRLEILLECVKIWSKPLTIEAQGSHGDIQGQWSKCGWMQKAWNYQSQSNSIILFYVSWNINEWILGCSRSGCPLILSQVIFIFIFRKGL